MNAKKYEELADEFERAIDGHVEYETQHVDAGNAYAHLLREGGWHYHNGEHRLMEFLSANEIACSPAVLEELIDHLLDWSEPQPRATWCAGSTKSTFVVESFAVGEIEDQYSLPDLANGLETDENTAREFAQLAMADSRFCLRANGDGGVLSYTYTDSVWSFEITVSEIRDLVAEWTADELEAANV